MLESMAVRQFAARATDEDRATLRHALQAIEATVEAPGAHRDDARGEEAVL